MKDQAQAYLYGLGAVLLWSTVASAFKLTLLRVGPVTLLFYSSLTSALFLLVLLLLEGRIGPLAGFSGYGGCCGERAGTEGGRKISPIALSLLGGLLNPLLYYTALFSAYRLLPAQEALPLNYTWPLAITLLSCLLRGERLRLRGVFALCLSLSGVYVISTRGAWAQVRVSSPMGAGLALGSALLWASFWLMNAADPRGAVKKLALNFTFGFPIVALLAFVLSRWERVAESIPWFGPASFPPPVDLPALLGCIYIGLFEMGLTFVLWLRALSLSPSTAKVSNLVYLSPFLSLLLVALVVGERILPSSLAGLALIVGGIALQGTVRE